MIQVSNLFLAYSIISVACKNNYRRHKIQHASLDKNIKSTTRYVKIHPSINSRQKFMKKKFSESMNP